MQQQANASPDRISAHTEVQLSRMESQMKCHVLQSRTQPGCDPDPPFGAACGSCGIIVNAKQKTGIYS
jgi:hypothetical protein